MTAIHPDPGPLTARDGDEGTAALDGVAAIDATELAPPSAMSRFVARVPRWLPPTLVGGLAIGSCIYVGLVDPNTSSSAFYPQCAFKQLTGFDCPGCGLTRAMHSVVTGHPLQALDHNILIAAILPLAVYTWFVWMSRSMFGWELPYVRVPRKVSYAIAPLILTFWVVRNIPWGPFAYLNSSAS